MSTLDLTSLRQATAALRDGLSVVDDAAWFEQQDPKVRQTLMAGVIQSFEFVYEVGVKMLRRQLEAEADTPVDVDQASFRDLLRMAAEKGLIDDVEAWFVFRQMRNITAYTYDLVKAQQVYAGLRGFLHHADALLARLASRDA
jgi:nucleotidyltransferase substrate binding protein (TIGR01987 family)